jgi:3-oxoacyl-[acyl-carrier-protein] synthase II
LSPIGNNVTAFWESLLAGRSGLGPIRSFDTTGLTVTHAGEVKDFQPEDRLSREEMRRLEGIHRFSLYAAREALTDAHIDVACIDPTRVGVLAA